MLLLLLVFFAEKMGRERSSVELASSVAIRSIVQEAARKKKSTIMAEKTVHEALWTLIQSFQETNQMITESFVTSQERSRRLAESFFTDGMEVLKANQAAAEQLMAAQERNR